MYIVTALCDGFLQKQLVKNSKDSTLHPAYRKSKGFSKLNSLNVRPWSHVWVVFDEENYPKNIFLTKEEAMKCGATPTKVPVNIVKDFTVYQGPANWQDTPKYNKVVNGQFDDTYAIVDGDVIDGEVCDLHGHTAAIVVVEINEVLYIGKPRINMRKVKISQRGKFLR